MDQRGCELRMTSDGVGWVKQEVGGGGGGKGGGKGGEGERAKWGQIFRWEASLDLKQSRAHSEHRFPAPSSKLCQIWLRH